MARLTATQRALILVAVAKLRADLEAEVASAARAVEEEQEIAGGSDHRGPAPCSSTGPDGGIAWRATSPR